MRRFAVGSSVVDVRRGSWSEVVESSTLPVVVDLWAPWCGPCRSLAPVLERVAADFAGRVLVVKVNVDEEPELAEAFNVRSLPTLHAMRGGEVFASRVGAPAEAVLRAFFEEAAAPATL